MAGTVTVTGAERGARLAVAILGLALLGLALPQLATALVRLPGDPVVFALRHGDTLSDEALIVLAETREATLGWWPDATSGREVAVAAVRLGRLRQAELASADALARAPVDPYGWLRLARLAKTGDAPPSRTLDLLRASITTGPYEPELTRQRVRMALDLWPSLTSADRMGLAGQARLLWQDDPDGLVALALDSVSAVRVAELLGDAAAIAAFAERRRAALEAADRN